MEYVDFLISTEEDTERVFKITGADYKEVAKVLADRFGFEVVAITLRENVSVWRNNWTAIAYSNGTFYDDKTYEVEIVDRVGSGDSFTAGFLAGYLEEGIQRGVKMGNALSAIKHSIPGDLNITTREEMETLLTKGGLRIVR